MEYLARLNIVAMLMSTTFWINLAVVFFVTLITYWLINWLLNVVYKALQRPDKRMMLMGGCGLLFSRC